MKKPKAKETAPGAELRRRAKVYEADAARSKAKEPALALRQEGRADGLLDAATFIDEWLAQGKPAEMPLDDVADLALAQRFDSRLDDLERRVTFLERPEHATAEAIGASQRAWEADPVPKGKPLPPSMADGGLLSDKPARAKRLRPNEPAPPSRPKILGPAHTNGAAELEDDPDVPAEAESSDYDLALILALGQSEAPLTAAQAALLAGFSPMSGALAKGIRRLRRGGIVAPAGDGRYRLTERGKAFQRIAGTKSLRTAEGLVTYWAGKLGEHKGTFLSIFAASSPEPVSHEELARRSGFSKKSGAFPKALRRLRRMHLLEEMRLSPEFVEILELKP